MFDIHKFNIFYVEVSIAMAHNQGLPANMSLLRLQEKHVTKAIWEGNERLIRPRRHSLLHEAHR